MEQNQRCRINILKNNLLKRNNILIVSDNRPCNVKTHITYGSFLSKPLSDNVIKRFHEIITAHCELLVGSSSCKGQTY
jgi:hypothetical protein